MPPNIQIGSKALITVDNWFFAPDGKTYRAVFGTVRAVRSSEETLGVKTNAKSTNWYVEIGDALIAGCQIHYAVRTDTCVLGAVTHTTYSAEAGPKQFPRPSEIYNADARGPGQEASNV